MTDIDSAWTSALSAIAAGSPGESSASASSPLRRVLDYAWAKERLRSWIESLIQGAALPSGQVASVQSSIQLLKEASTSPKEAASLVTDAVGETVRALVSTVLSELDDSADPSEVVSQLADHRRRVDDGLKRLAGSTGLYSEVRLSSGESFQTELIAQLPNHAKAVKKLRKAVACSFLSTDATQASQLRDNLFSLGLGSFARLAAEETAKVTIQETMRRAIGVPSDALQCSSWELGFRCDIAEEAMLTGALDRSVVFPLGAEQQARPLLIKQIRERITPALAAWSQSSSPGDPEAESDRLVYFLDESLLRARTYQFFDLLAGWPISTPAVSDLKAALEEMDARVYVSREISKALDKRLLHPGARTRDVLQLYVSLVYAVRFIDPHGVILSRVASPIRRYLRSRSDTIAVIVSSLLGDGNGVAELRSELDAASRNDAAADHSYTGGAAGAAGDTTADITMGDDESRVITGPGTDAGPALNSTSASSGRGAAGSSPNERIVDYSDPHWRPRPIDAGPSYRQTQGADIIAMLVSIFDDRASFVKALEVSTARALLKCTGYNISQEFRNNEVLKRRFGDVALSRCDVMLQDILDSHRVSSSIRQLFEASEGSLSAQVRKRMPREQDRLVAAQDATLRALKPLITSRHFWPDLEGTENVTMAGPTGATGASAALSDGGAGSAGGAGPPAAMLGSVGPPPGGVGMRLPGSLGRAMDAYNRGFTAVRESRRLRWLSGYGSVEVKVEMRDGRTWVERVDPVKAAVLVAAGDQGATPEAPLSKAQLTEEMGLSGGGGGDVRGRSLVDGAFAYWVGKNVLIEVAGRAGWYVECFSPSDEERG
ncbi:unnamed protein product [Parajaminaea phylloscopi]